LVRVEATLGHWAPVGPFGRTVAPLDKALWYYCL